MGIGTVARLFHWVTVLLVLVMIPVGLMMIQDIPRPLQDPLFILHKGLGPVVLRGGAARLALAGVPPAAAAAGEHAGAAARAPRLVHAGLYVFLLVQAVSGYVRVTTGGFPHRDAAGARHPAAVPKAEAVGEVASSDARGLGRRA